MSHMPVAGTFDVAGIQDLSFNEVELVDGGATVGEAFLVGAGAGAVVGSVGGAGGTIAGAVVGGLIGVALYYVP